MEVRINLPPFLCLNYCILYISLKPGLTDGLPEITITIKIKCNEMLII